MIKLLKSTWTDQDLLARDRTHQRGAPHQGKHPHSRAAHFQDVDEETEPTGVGAIEDEVTPEEAQDDDGVLALEEYVAMSEGQAAAANRTWAEARRILNEVQKARGFYPVVGLAALPPGGRGAAEARGSQASGPSGPRGPPRVPKEGAARARPAQPAGGTRAPPSGPPRAPRPLRCLICRGPHKTVDCPHKHKSDQQMSSSGVVIEELDESTSLAGCVAHWDGPEGQAEPVSSALVLHALFTMADLVGYAIVDSGATRSMSGINLIAYLQEQICKALGSDEIEFDETVKITFTYANSTKGKSLGAAGVPHPLALSAQRGCLWFALVPTSSPTLLGLDYLKAAEADVTHDGYLVYSDGHREALTALPSGHWGLPLL